MQQNLDTKTKKPCTKKSPTQNSRILYPETRMAAALTPAEAVEVVQRSQKMALD